MLAPTIWWCLLKSICMYLPKRLLLSLRVVFALPNASIIGLDAKTFFSICVSSVDPPTFAKYRIVYLALTVLPAPDSPETMIDWFCSNLHKQWHNELFKSCFELWSILTVEVFGTLLRRPQIYVGRGSEHHGRETPARSHCRKSVTVRMGLWQPKQCHNTCIFDYC